MGFLILSVVGLLWSPFFQLWGLYTMSYLPATENTHILVGLPRCQPFTSATSIKTDAQNDENRMLKVLSLSLWLLVCCSVCNIAMLRNCRYATHSLSLLNTSMHHKTWCRSNLLEY
ncbi:hypothetical protein BDR26DRAFT_853556 [Obelidium mucronatum]|nr:hypothetical protein BDR26DRAFT_853556 [Obelidium mucronatum]